MNTSHALLWFCCGQKFIHILKYHIAGTGKYDYPSDREATLKGMGKYMLRIHYELLV